jgi:transcriptional regulator with XRE-family HTH domain
MTLEQAARKLSISPSYLRRIELGYVPCEHTARQIARVFGVTMNQIVMLSPYSDSRPRSATAKQGNKTNGEVRPRDSSKPAPMNACDQVH